MRLPRRTRHFRLLFALLPALLLAACAGHVSGPASSGLQYAPSQYYPPPGPPSDPWGPYIQEAAARYQIPAQWIRAVMHQESGGQEQAVSPVGAIGLMQVMPATYDTLRAANGLGPDPFNPEDNILAGAAYIKQMYDIYGSPGFLAAYNAGPGRLDDYLTGGGQLPDETVNYLAAVAPNLGDSVAPSGPLAQYASASGGIAPTAVSFATGCDVNAAYNPSHPCSVAAPAGGVPQGPVVASAGVCNANLAYDPDDPCSGGAGGTGSCSLDSAYDPDNPCAPAQPAPITAVAEAGPPVPAQSQSETEPEGSALAAATPPEPSGAPSGSMLGEASGPAPAVAVIGPSSSGECDPDAAYNPRHPCAPPPSAPVRSAPERFAHVQAPPRSGNWSVQVGAFASPGLARAVAEGARTEAPGLANAGIELPKMAPFGGLVLYQARLVHLTATDAIRACGALNHRQLPCVVVPGPGA